jgi:hypothetical protein
VLSVKQGATDSSKDAREPRRRKMTQIRVHGPLCKVCLLLAVLAKGKLSSSLNLTAGMVSIKPFTRVMDRGGVRVVFEFRLGKKISD